VATVVIPGGGKGDRPAGSPGVKVPVGWSRMTYSGWIRTGGRASRQVVAEANEEASKPNAHVKRIVGASGLPSPLGRGEGQSRR
jgi:hypothetical protein